MRQYNPRPIPINQGGFKMPNYPYSDDYMQYDFLMHRYVLTPQCVQEYLGVNLERYNSPNAVDAILRQISNKIYAYIHDYNVNNDLQDYIIAKTESGRRIIKEAMEQQFLYESAVGNVDVILSAEKRSFRIAPVAESVLLRIIPEIGTTILYTGCLRLNARYDDTRW